VRPEYHRDCRGALQYPQHNHRGSTGLGSNSGYQNYVSYSTFVAVATANTIGSPVQTAAVSALKSYAAPIYGSRMVEISAWHVRDDKQR
jgi:hypothetical protein